MVPIVPLESMLLEPSSGSNATMYFPFWLCSQIMGYSSSSLARMHTRIVEIKQFLNISFEITSSFFCSSPEVLVCPCIPYRLYSPAFEIFELIILQASAIEFITKVKSPLAFSHFICWISRCRVKVTGFVSIDSIFN